MQECSTLVAVGQNEVMVEVDSPLGVLRVYSTEVGICSLLFDDGALGRTGDRTERAGQLEHLAAEQLREYFAGTRRAFDVPLDLAGTDFQRAAWAALCTIPFGETRTYSDEARIIGRPKAVRAAGSANGRNPVPILVPCHRVVAANGLGGFSSGIERKVILLEHEQRFRA